MLEPIYPFNSDDEKEEGRMISPPRMARRRSLRFTGPIRREMISDALLEIQAKWFVEEMGSHLLKRDKETAEVDTAYIDRNVHSTLYLCKDKYYGWFFLKKKIVRRTVLRVTDFLYNSESKFLRCELFLENQVLRNIADRVLYHLAGELGYIGIEIVDMSKDRSAWYPDKPPEARVLK